MAKLSLVPHRPTDPNVSFDDYSLDGMRRADAYVQKLMETSAAKDPDDPNLDLKGFVLTFPRGDGHAVYIVSKVRPLTVEHVPVCDAWRAYPEGIIIGGITKKYIMEMLRFEKSMKQGVRGVRERGWAPGN